MKNFLECLIIAALFFIATTALLTVDSRAGRLCGAQDPVQASAAVAVTVI